jgi:hypothetical protein
VPTAVPPVYRPPTANPGADGANDPNPYQKQSAANTNTGWLPSTTLHLDLKSIRDYAVYLTSVQADLPSLTGRLQPMTSLLTQGWNGPVLPEAAYAQQSFSRNQSELMAFLENLGVGIGNVAMAAQAVADYYGNSDGWSAADLDAVKFAFGDNGVPTPAEWPYTKSITTAEDTKLTPPGDVWTPVGLPTKSTHGGTTTTVVTMVNERGQKQTATTVVSSGRTVTTTVGPDGTFTETTVVNPDGSKLTTSVAPGKKTTTTHTWTSPEGTVNTVSTFNGQQTSSSATVTVLVPGGRQTVTTRYDGKGNITGSTVDLVSTDAHGNATGERVIDYAYDQGKQTVVQDVSTGQPTPGVSEPPSVFADAQRDIAARQAAADAARAQAQMQQQGWTVE